VGGAVTGHVELEDRRVVNESIDGRGGGHGVLEDPVPLAEDEVARSLSDLCTIYCGKADLGPDRAPFFVS